MIVVGLPTGGGAGTTRDRRGRLIIRGTAKSQQQSNIDLIQRQQEGQLLAAEDLEANRLEIKALAQHGSWEIRRAIAARPDCPHKILLLLSQDPDGRVCNVAKYALKNPQKVHAAPPLANLPSWQDLVNLARSFMQSR